MVSQAGRQAGRWRVRDPKIAAPRFASWQTPLVAGHGMSGGAGFGAARSLGTGRWGARHGPSLQPGRYHVTGPDRARPLADCRPARDGEPGQGLCQPHLQGRVAPKPRLHTGVQHYLQQPRLAPVRPLRRWRRCTRKRCRCRAMGYGAPVLAYSIPDRPPTRDAAETCIPSNGFIVEMPGGGPHAPRALPGCRLLAPSRSL